VASKEITRLLPGAKERAQVADDEHIDADHAGGEDAVDEGTLDDEVNIEEL